MDLNGTVTVIMNVFSRFESLWTGMTHPHKFKDRVCTLIFFLSFSRYPTERILILHYIFSTGYAFSCLVCIYAELIS